MRGRAKAARRGPPPPAVRGADRGRRDMAAGRAAVAGRQRETHEPLKNTPLSAPKKAKRRVVKK